MMKRVLAALAAAGCLSLAGAGVVRSPAARRSRAAELADLFGHVSTASATARSRRSRRTTSRTSSCSGCFRRGRSRKFEATPLVVDGVMYTVQAPNDVVALDAATGRIVLGVLVSAVAAGARLLRPRQSRPRDPRRHAVHGHDRRPSDRGRRQERQADLGRARVAQPEAGYCVHARAAGRQRQGHRRTGRRRIRHPRVPRRVRRQDRQGSVALQHHPRAGRAGTRNLGRRFLEDRRRLDLGDRLVRSGSQPDVLGHRQSRSRLERRSAPGRQPLHRFGRRARCRHRQAEVALPVLAA